MFDKARSGYALLPLKLAGDSEDDVHGLPEFPPPRRWQSRFSAVFPVLLAGIALVTFGAVSGSLVTKSVLGRPQSEVSLPPSDPPSSACVEPVIRREWRTLSLEERAEYIDAVQCTRKLPSKIGMHQTLYDDFPWVHSRIGNYSHETAAFLAWHRYFVHVYERTLQTDCGYSGHIPYWNWALDWQSFAASPIWSPTSGFGGDGDPDGPETVGMGRCVKDGPFADVVALYYDVDSTPHCLSRGFNTGEEMWKLCLSQIMPAALEALLRRDDYNHFNLGMEHGPHFALPFGVRGDFHNFTAPYDPVFFLHHAQLDRLWWMWQQMKPEKRLWEYNGHSGDDPSRPAALTDPLYIGDLAPTVQAKDIMNTESELLCYRY